MGWAMLSSFCLKACMTLAALAGWNSGSLVSMSKRPVHSTKVPTALALPVPWELTVYNLEGPHMDAEHVWDLATAVFALAARQALVLRLA